MAKWKEKSRVNLLSLSIETQDCLTAAQEWEFNGHIIDHGHSRNRCELCEGENLRHHFQIVNIKNKNLLWVGSSCIHKFDILVRDDNGLEIGDIKKKKKYLNKKLADKKREYFLDSLRSLWKTVDDSEKFVVERVGKSCRDKENIYPELAVDFLKINQKYNTDIEFSHLKVSARASYNIDSIARMPIEDRTLLFKVLSKKQIERINRTVLQFKIDAERDIEHNNTYLDELALRKSKRQAQKHTEQPTIYKSTRTDIYVMPEYITCSVCGKYTKDSACFNPDMCRDCIGKKQ